MGRIRFVKSKDMFKRALRRGVSYHHAGLDNKKRSCVEMLFRKKCLQVRFHWKYLNCSVRYIDTWSLLALKCLYGQQGFFSFGISIMCKKVL